MSASMLWGLSMVLLATVAFAEEAPLCLPATDSSSDSICTSSSVKHGKAISQIASTLTEALDAADLADFSFQPTSYDAEVPPAEGPFALNTLLDTDTTIIFSGLIGPESIAHKDGYLYTGNAQGIYKANLATEEFSLIKKLCSEPDCSHALGMRVGNGNDLYFADARLGLCKIDTETGDFEVLVEQGEIIEGEPVTFADDLDIDLEENVIYFSDGSTKWPIDNYLMSVMEFEKTGRIIKYDISSKESSVFAKNISFANGVQISHDRKHLLVSEFNARRLLRFPLNATTHATAEVFSSLLPGNPDNIRPSSSGGYWVTMVLPRFNGTRTLMDKLQADPKASKALATMMLSGSTIAQTIYDLTGQEMFSGAATQLKTGRLLLNTFPVAGIVLEFDKDGNVVQSLHSRRNSFFTEAFEGDDALYLGSYLNSFILKVPKEHFRNLKRPS